MEHIYVDADKIAFTFCFAMAALATAAYWKWHYWWKTGPGRGRMAVIVAFAGITAERTARRWTIIRLGTIPDHVLDIIRLSSALLAAIALAYLLAGILSVNFRRARDPVFAADLGRRHLERTPGATQQEIKELLTCWDELHDPNRLTP